MTLYLADAVALIDFYTGDPAFPKHLIRFFEDTPDAIAVAATTVWEIAIKTRLGKLPAPRPGLPIPRRHAPPPRLRAPAA